MISMLNIFIKYKFTTFFYLKIYERDRKREIYR